jgi:arylsulfatase A-like enzyme
MQQHTIKLFFVFLTGFIMAFVFSGIQGYPPPIPASVCSHCNIIVAAISPLRADTANNCDKKENAVMPHLCTFTESSIVFDQTFAPSSQALPNIMSLLTSALPIAHDAWQPFTPFPIPKQIPLPQLLKQYGYKTVYVGPMWDGKIRLHKRLSDGFDTHIESYSVSDWPHILEEILKDSENQKPAFVFFYNTGLKSSWLHTTNEAMQDTAHAGDMRIFAQHLLEATINSMKNLEFSSDNLRRVSELLTLDKGIGNPYSLLQELSKNEQDFILKSEDFTSLGKSDKSILEHLHEDYQKQAHSLDASLRPFFSLLTALNAKNNTVSVFTAGHGEEFGEHGTLGHGTNIYETVTHIPLIISIPSMPSQTQKVLTQTIDIYPTLLETVGIPIPKHTMGISMLPTITQKAGAPRNEYVFTQLDRYQSIYSIRDLKWSYYWDDSSTYYHEELYDLTADPHEQKNVASLYPKQTKFLNDHLNRTNRYLRLHYRYKSFE